jgi:hypothetical protein
MTLPKRPRVYFCDDPVCRVRDALRARLDDLELAHLDD